MNKGKIIGILTAIVVLGGAIGGVVIYKNNKINNSIKVFNQYVQDYKGAMDSKIIDTDKQKYEELLNKSKKLIESKDVKDIDNYKAELDNFKNDEEAKIQDQKKREEEIARVIESNGDYNLLFKNAAFMGDSITKGISEYGVLNDQKIFAHIGDTVAKGLTYVNKVIAAKPQNIIVAYGMNDLEMLNPSDESGSIENFKQKYTELINKLKTELPNSKIYAQAPFSVVEIITMANSKNLSMKNVLAIREAIESICETSGVTYMDVPKEIKEHDELHEGDGIHYKYDFYEMWLKSIAKIMK